MGPIASKLSDLFADFAGQGTPARILMLGLDSSGKTTVLYKVKLNKPVSTIPTVGFNVETVRPVHGVSFTVWDVGGQDKLRPMWRHFSQSTDGLIYVVDSNDRERIVEAREELFRILDSDEMKGVPVVVIANKQDLPGALSAAELLEQLHMEKLHGRKWHVQAACACSGDGIYVAMHQLSDMVKEFKKSRR